MFLKVLRDDTRLFNGPNHLETAFVQSRLTAVAAIFACFIERGTLGKKKTKK